MRDDFADYEVEQDGSVIGVAKDGGSQDTLSGTFTGAATDRVAVGSYASGSQWASITLVGIVDVS